MKVQTELAMPTCIGIIMDGNRRWAVSRGVFKLEGHRAGSTKLKETVRLARARGVKHLIVYAFSTENWNRESTEVSYLMDLFREFVKREAAELGNEGVRIRFVGQRERFAADMQAMMSDIEQKTEKNDTLTLWVCFSYGGRAEIVAAAREAARVGDITEESLARCLWTAEMPEPDIVIRTGGEKRLSNFLPWQSIYSELFFSDSYWPDFSVEEFDAILSEFSARERRRGK